MDPLTNMLKEITSDLKSYLEARIDLLFLSVSETITRWIGHSVQQLLGLSILLLGFVFALTAGSIALGEWLEHPWLGYLIVSLPLLILGGFLLFSRPSALSKSIQKQLMSDILRSLDEKDSGQKALPSPKQKEKKEQ